MCAWRREGGWCIICSGYHRTTYSGWSRNSEKGGGARQCNSMSYFIRNAHNKPYASDTRNGDLGYWKKILRPIGRAIASRLHPPVPLWIRHWQANNLRCCLSMQASCWLTCLRTSWVLKPNVLKHAVILCCVKLHLTNLMPHTHKSVATNGHA